MQGGDRFGVLFPVVQVEGFMDGVAHFDQLRSLANFIVPRRGFGSGMICIDESRLQALMNTLVLIIEVAEGTVERQRFAGLPRCRQYLDIEGCRLAAAQIADRYA